MSNDPPRPFSFLFVVVVGGGGGFVVVAVCLFVFIVCLLLKLMRKIKKKMYPNALVYVCVLLMLSLLVELLVPPLSSMTCLRFLSPVCKFIGHLHARIPSLFAYEPVNFSVNLKRQVTVVVVFSLLMQCKMMDVFKHTQCRILTLQPSDWYANYWATLEGLVERERGRERAQRKTGKE